MSATIDFDHFCYVADDLVLGARLSVASPFWVFEIPVPEYLSCLQNSIHKLVYKIDTWD